MDRSRERSSYPFGALIGDYRTRFGVSEAATLELSLERCATRVRITVMSAGETTATYEVASTDAGPNLLSVADGSTTALLCEVPEF